MSGNYAGRGSVMARGHDQDDIVDGPEVSKIHNERHYILTCHHNAE
jgi:hypothetical protein